MSRFPKTQRGRASSYEPAQPRAFISMGDTGLEDMTESSRNSDVSKSGGAECGADAAGWHLPVAQDDPDLKKLSEGWSALPVEIRAGIMLIASSYKSSGGHQW